MAKVFENKFKERLYEKKKQQIEDDSWGLFSSPEDAKTEAFNAVVNIDPKEARDRLNIKDFVSIYKDTPEIKEITNKFISDSTDRSSMVKEGKLPVPYIYDVISNTALEPSGYSSVFFPKMEEQSEQVSEILRDMTASNIDRGNIYGIDPKAAEVVLGVGEEDLNKPTKITKKLREYLSEGSNFDKVNKLKNLGFTSEQADDIVSNDPNKEDENETKVISFLSNSIEFKNDMLNPDKQKDKTIDNQNISTDAGKDISKDSLVNDKRSATEMVLDSINSSILLEANADTGDFFSLSKPTQIRLKEDLDNKFKNAETAYLLSVLTLDRGGAGNLIKSKSAMDSYKSMRDRVNSLINTANTDSPEVSLTAKQEANKELQSIRSQLTGIAQKSPESVIQKLTAISQLRNSILAGQQAASKLKAGDLTNLNTGDLITQIKDLGNIRKSLLDSDGYGVELLSNVDKIMSSITEDVKRIQGVRSTSKILNENK